MRRLVSALVLVPLIATGCKDASSATEPIEIDLHRSGGSHSGFPSRTTLSGDEEVPPRATIASGKATFRLSGDGETMRYTLRVEDINNVVQAHIHVAAKGANGPVVQFLFGLVPANGGPAPERLAAGEFTAASFQGPLRGRPMSELVALMQSGGAYVNVHTNDGNAATIEGPGDFAGGEIRGQLGDRDRHGGHDGDEDDD